MSMQFNKIAGSDLNVSKICLGTMTFGQQNSQNEAFQQLNFAFDKGINFIDTAEMYPVPPREETVYSTESIVGNWLKDQDRNKVILATKAVGSNRGMAYIRENNLSFNKANLRSALEASLKRLQTDYVDLYQLHWPERNTPMFGQYLYNPKFEKEYTAFRETLEALNDLINEGKIRYIGVSNEWPWGIMQFIKAADEFNLPRIISTQNAYSLLNRTFDSALREVSYRENVPLLAYSPLAFGHLSGKYIKDSKARGRVNDFEGFAQRYEKPAVHPAVKAYSDLADEIGISLTTLALSFNYSRWFSASTIIGATSMQQLEENITSLDFKWTDEVESRIEQIHLSFFNPAP